MNDPFRIYHSFPECTPPPPFKHLYATVPESILPPRIHSLLTSMYLPEYPPPFLNIYMRTSVNLPLPPKIYPSFCHPLYVKFPESTTSSHIIPFLSIYMRSSDNLLPPRVYSLLKIYMRHCQNLSPFSPTTVSPRINENALLFENALIFSNVSACTCIRT